MLNELNESNGSNGSPGAVNEPTIAMLDLVMSRDLRNAAKTMNRNQARFLVDAYYMMQQRRITANDQRRAMADEPHDVLDFLAQANQTLEYQVAAALAKYTEADPIGQWMREIMGVGPVIAAGFLAHIDITKAETAGAVWRFAGQDPTCIWKKGEKRPWNADLKTLCWKLGNSFVKVSGKEKSVYGRLYRERKAQEIAKNEAGEFAKQAAGILAARNIGKDTDAYKAYVQGKLPPAHLDARARRYAIKLFLAHLHAAMYRHHHGRMEPKPYILAHSNGEHVHEITPEVDIPFPVAA